jgi:hypothetical protein
LQLSAGNRLKAPNQTPFCASFDPTGSGITALTILQKYPATICRDLDLSCGAGDSSHYLQRIGAFSPIFGKILASRIVHDVIDCAKKAAQQAAF